MLKRYLKITHSLTAEVSPQIECSSNTMEKDEVIKMIPSPKFRFGRRWRVREPDEGLSCSTKPSPVSAPLATRATQSHPLPQAGEGTLKIKIPSLSVLAGRKWRVREPDEGLSCSTTPSPVSAPLALRATQSHPLPNQNLGEGIILAKGKATSAIKSRYE